MPIGKHTYIKRDGIYKIGFLMLQKPDRTQSFVQLFDVATLADAIASVNMLNGGSPVRGIAVLKEYGDQASPLPVTSS